MTHIFGQYIHEGIVSIMIAITGGILMWPYKKVKNAYKELKDAVQSTHAELVLQRENCLSTLQIQGIEQIKVLNKVADTLDGVRLDLAEQTGYLAGTAHRRRGSEKKS